MATSRARKAGRIAKKPLRVVKEAIAAAASAAGPLPAELVSMQEAIAMLKTTRPTFYRWVRAGKLKGMKLGRQWRFYREELDRFLKGEAPRTDLPADITPLLKELRGQLKQTRGVDRELAGLPPIQQAARLMALLGVELRASDIHVGAVVEGGEAGPAVIRYRVDGVLRKAASFDRRLLPALAAEWKRMAACDVNEKAKPQDGCISLRLSELDPSQSARALDMRVCFIPCVLGESFTIRLLDPRAVVLDLDRMGYAPADMERILRALSLPAGLIVVTGPAGSGKTTALYACLHHLDKPEIKIMTIEDPVEILLVNSTQIQINPVGGLTFIRAIRATLRSDPDVILVGELRDGETLAAAQQAALTGHVVLTTLHTNDAVQGLVRMVEMGSDPFVVADSTKLILAQRLLRRLCPQCSQPDTPSPARAELAMEAARKGGLDWSALKAEFRRPVGCAECRKLGYRGRMAVAETLEVTPEISRALRQRASLDELRALAVSQGMTTLAADGIRRAAAGETSLDQVVGLVT